jgi:ribosomal protein S18 acetylase RimI-like enzyme
MKIRPMTVRDKSGVMRILQTTPEFNALDLIVAEEVIDSYLEDPAGSGYQVLVAEAQQSLSGYVCYGFNNMTQSTWDVYWIAVARSHQGQGIGRELLSAAENYIQAAGGKLIIIETSSTPDYDRTNRFYRLRGYKLVCQIADFYGPGDDQIIYEKRFQGG